MIATISPNISNSEHSLNTLRYADRYSISSFIHRVKELKGASDLYDEELSFETSFVDHNTRIYDSARRNSGMIGDLSPEDDLLEQEYPPEGLMSEDDLNITERYSKSMEYSEKVMIGSPKYGSPTSIRSRSSVRIMDKKNSINNSRKGSTGNLLEERARSPSLRRNNIRQCKS